MAIIIGDIHGNVEKVKAFLAYRPDQEHVALGDYVDSFHEPPERQLEALRLLLDSSAVLLWGNHDIHYLRIPPWTCTGFQNPGYKPFQRLIEANKGRFKAAVAVDGWLCTHAGVHSAILENFESSDDIEAIAEMLNIEMVKFLKTPEILERINYISPGPPIMHIGYARGGNSPYSGIYWYDFRRESGLAPIKQIFGHTETKEPVVTETYVALDTTNDKSNCWIYDTATNELVSLPVKRNCEYIPQNGGA